MYSSNIFIEVLIKSQMWKGMGFNMKTELSALDISKNGCLAFNSVCTIYNVWKFTLPAHVEKLKLLSIRKDHNSCFSSSWVFYLKIQNLDIVWLLLIWVFKFNTSQI